MRALKLCIIGVVIGLLELAAISGISILWKVGSFEDMAFIFGLGTLLIGLLALFGTKRVHSGMNIFPENSVAQTSFQTDITFREANLVKKLPRLSGELKKTLVLFIAAAVVFIGFGISLIL